MTEETISFPSGRGTVRGKLFRGEEKGAVICHPHPLYGGNMNNNVVLAARDVFAENGWSTLRFDFQSADEERGVEDAAAALEAVQKECGVESDRLVLAGYSYGAWLGLRALVDGPPVAGWLAVAPPLAMWDFSFTASITGEKAPGIKGMVAGERDQFCPADSLLTLFDSLPEPKGLKILPRTDHFFVGGEQALAGAIREIFIERF